MQRGGTCSLPALGICLHEKACVREKGKHQELLQAYAQGTDMDRQVTPVKPNKEPEFQMQHPTVLKQGVLLKSLKLWTLVE